MKHLRILLIISLIGIYHSLYAQITPEWASAYIMNYPTDIRQRDMATDKLGNVYITGYCQDTINASGIILKYNSQGNLIRAITNDTVYSFNKVAIDDSFNIYVLGDFNYGFRLIKYDSSGLFLWCYALNNPWTYGYDLMIADSNYLYVSGSNSNKFVTLKFDNMGNLIWSKVDDYIAGTYDTFLAIDGINNAYVTGRKYDSLYSFTCNTFKYNSSGTKLWEQVYNGNFNPGLAQPVDIKYDKNGFIYVLTVTSNNNNLQGDYALVKYDTSGNEIWSSSYSFSSYYDIPEALAVDKLGNAYATGHIYQTGGTADSLATIKFDQNGNLKWVRKYSSGHHNLDEAYAIAIDSHSNIYITGTSPDNLNQGNFITIKYDSAGNEIWVAKYLHNNTSGNRANSICLTNDGDIFIAGNGYGVNSWGIITVKYSYDVSISELKNNLDINLDVFPNPFETYVTIKAERNLKNGNLFIYDIHGKIIISLYNINENAIIINGNNLPAGIYFYKIFDKEILISKGKIIAD